MTSSEIWRHLTSFIGTTAACFKDFLWVLFSMHVKILDWVFETIKNEEMRIEFDYCDLWAWIVPKEKVELHLFYNRFESIEELKFTCVIFRDLFLFYINLPSNTHRLWLGKEDINYKSCKSIQMMSLHCVHYPITITPAYP